MLKLFTYWNPITGCTPISEGCQNCYARHIAQRLRGRCGYPADEPFRVTFHPERLEEPLKWRKPRRVFVCSMGDLFHEDVSAGYISEIFRVMEKCPQHIFLLLTKRPQIMRRLLNGVATGWEPEHRKHIWLGVTAENQKQANKRIPILLETPAAVRFVSVEPMLGPVNLKGYFGEPECGKHFCERCGDCLACYGYDYSCYDSEPHLWPDIPRLNWVICGCEFGPGARPLHPDWVRGLRDQCQAAGVPFFFKQMADPFVGKKAAGRLLGDREWNEYPEKGD